MPAGRPPNSILCEALGPVISIENVRLEKEAAAALIRIIDEAREISEARLRGEPTPSVDGVFSRGVHADQFLVRVVVDSMDVPEHVDVHIAFLNRRSKQPEVHSDSSSIKPGGSLSPDMRSAPPGHVGVCLATD
jgi:hypothetical protein